MKDFHSETIRTVDRGIAEASTFEIHSQEPPTISLDSKEVYEFLVNHSKEIILVLGRTGKILFANQTALTTFGYAKEDLPDMSLSRFLTKSGLIKAFYVLAQEFLGHPQPEFELEAKTESGEIRYINVAEGSAPVRKDGKIVGLMITASDITEQRRAKIELQESEQRFRDLWDNAPVAYHTADTRGVITDVNQTEARLLGFRKEELIGKSVFELISPEQKADAQERFRKKIIGHSLPRSENRVFIGKNGSRIFVAVDDTLERDGGGRIVAIRSTFVDITKLRESEEHFRDLVEKSGIAILVDDREGRLKYFNERYAQIFGYSMDEMKRQTIWSTVHPDDIEKIRACHKGRLEGRDVPSRYEYKAVRKDGSVIYLEVDVVVLKEGDRYVGTRSYQWDVTERKLAEENQRESTERLRSFAKHSHDAILILNDAFQIIYANPAASLVSAYAHEEIIGRNFTDFIDSDSKKLVKDIYIRRQKGQPVPPRYEFNIVRKDGEKRRMEISSSVITNAAGKMETLAQLRDITDRKRAEDELKASEEKFKILFEYAPDAYYLADVKGILVDANKTAEKMMGYQREELVGKSLLTKYIISADQIPKAALLLARNARGHPIGPEEFVLTKKDKSEIPVEIRNYPVKMNDKTLVLGIARDITERKRTEAELKTSLENLRKIIGATVQAIATAVEARDPYTAGHQKRVADLARSIAKEMGLPRDTIEGIRTAGVIHDLGKLSVPAEILSKPTKLADVEFELIKTHSQSGYEILKDISFPWPVARMVLEHHERMDGSGYPRGLKGEEILIESKILAVADVVEAIASDRPYRPARGIEAALQEVFANRGLAYDPDVVTACLKVFEKGYQFPDGKRRETSS